MADLSAFNQRYYDMLRYYVTQVLPDVLPTLSDADKARAERLQADVRAVPAYAEADNETIARMQRECDEKIAKCELKADEIELYHAKRQNICPRAKPTDTYEKLKSAIKTATEQSQLLMQFTLDDPPELPKGDIQTAITTIYDGSQPIEDASKARTMNEALTCVQSNERDVNSCLRGKPWKTISELAAKVDETITYKQKCKEADLKKTPEYIALVEAEQRELQLIDEQEKVMNDLAVKLFASFHYTDTVLKRVNKFLEKFRTLDLTEQVTVLATQVRNLNPETTIEGLNESLNTLLGIPLLFTSTNITGGATPVEAASESQTQEQQEATPERPRNDMLEQIRAQRERVAARRAAASETQQRQQETAVTSQESTSERPENQTMAELLRAQREQFAARRAAASETQQATPLAPLSAATSQQPAPRVPNALPLPSTLADWQSHVLTMQRQYTSDPDSLRFNQFKNQYRRRDKLIFYKKFNVFYEAYCCNQLAQQIPSYQVYIANFELYNPPKDAVMPTNLPEIDNDELIMLKRWSRTISNLFKSTFTTERSFVDQFKSDALEEIVCNLELRAFYTVLNNEILLQCNLPVQVRLQILEFKTYLRQLFAFKLPNREVLESMTNVERSIAQRKLEKRNQVDITTRQLYTMLTPVGVFSMLPRIEVPDELPLTYEQQKERELLQLQIDIELAKQKRQQREQPEQAQTVRSQPWETSRRPLAPRFTRRPVATPEAESFATATTSLSPGPDIIGGSHTPENSLLRALHPTVKDMRRKARKTVPRDPLLHALYMTSIR